MAITIANIPHGINHQIDMSEKNFTNYENNKLVDNTTMNLISVTRKVLVLE